MRMTVLVIATLVLTTACTTALPTANEDSSAVAEMTTSATTTAPTTTPPPPDPTLVPKMMEAHPEFVKMIDSGQSTPSVWGYRDGATNRELRFSNEFSQHGDNVPELTMLSAQFYKGQGAMRTLNVFWCGSSAPRDITASLKSFDEAVASFKTSYKAVELENEPGTFEADGSAEGCKVKFVAAATG